MKDVLLAAMPQEIDLAERLAAAMSISVTSIEVDVFPDRETRVLAPKAANTTILYCSLDNPNEKLVAAHACRICIARSWRSKDHSGGALSLLYAPGQSVS